MVLCVYTTRTGISKNIADIVAKRYNAELLEISDGKDYKGIWGYIAAAVAGLKRKLPEILPYTAERSLEDYEKVFIVAPVWCEKINPMIRRFLLDNKGKFGGDIYYIIDHMADLSYEDKIISLDNLTGKKCEEYLSLKSYKCDYEKPLNEFLRNIDE